MKHQPQEQTIIDILEIIFPRHHAKKAARTAVEFFLQEMQTPGILPGEAHRNCDMNTLQRFVEFMIERGYN